MKTEVGIKNAGKQERNPRLKATLESIWNIKQIGMSRLDARGARRFFRQHKHVLMDEAGGAIINALGSLSLSFFFVAVMVFAVRTDSRLAASNERIDHLQFEVRTLTHTVGELNRDLMCATNSTLTSGGSR